MTIIEAINRIDKLLHNTYSQEDKITWLSRVDHMVYNHIVKTHEGAERVSFFGYNETTDIDTMLLVPEPYSEVYIRWLEAQIHYANGEYGKYNNAIIQFNTEYEAYSNYYNRNHMPLHSGTRFIF